MKNIAVIFPCREEVKERMKKAAPGCRFAFVEGMSRAERAGFIKRANAIIGEPDLSEIKAAGELTWVQMSWSGTDKYTKRKDFPEQVVLTNATGIFGKGIAEWLLGTLLSLYKKLPEYRDRQKEQVWKDMGKEKSLYGKTVLIIGAGDIGTSFAKLLVPFGTRNLGVRRRKKEGSEAFMEMHTIEELDGLLPEADVVVMALPDTAETEGLMNLERLHLMKKDAVLLNAGRGGTLVTEDLITVLEEGRLYGVGLDVVMPEPLPEDSPLWNFDRVLLTPHISGQGLGHLDETYEAITELLIENVGRFDRGEPLLNVVDKKAGYRE